MTSLDDLRAKLKAQHATPVAQNPQPASADTKLLIAIAHVNGHSQPKVWAKQVTDYLATLA